MSSKKETSKKETVAQKAEREREQKIFSDVGVDPNAQIDSQDIDKYIQQQAELQQAEDNRRKLVSGKVALINSFPGRSGDYTLDHEGNLFKKGGKKRRKTHRRSKKSKKSKKSRRHRR